MLELVGISHHISRGKEGDLHVLDNISFTTPAGHLLAVIGPTLSGKSALLHVIAGFIKPSHGAMVWHGKDIARQPPHPNEVGFVPQADDVLHDALTVQENIVSAMLLRVGGLEKSEAVNRAAHMMVLTGLETVSKRKTSELSKPQRRRLKLALALVSEPSLVLCDEFTDGLDARSERELAALLQMVARDNPKRLVINVTQTLTNLSTYDTVLLLHEGRNCFHGPARALGHYFSVKQIEEIYSRLAKRPASRWGESWDKHRDTYYNAFKLGTDPAALEAADDEGSEAVSKKAAESASGSAQARLAETTPGAGESPPVAPLPSLVSQLQHLLRRRWTVFRRSKGEWATHLAMLTGFPLLCVLLVWRQRMVLTDESPAGDAVFQSAYVASMAVLIQVLLVVAMAVRNGAGEIAGERSVFERERLSGLRPGAYLTGKILFLATLFIAQGAWLALFVDMMTGGLPGHALVRLGLLVGTGAALSFLALGISANCLTAARASSLSLWLALAQIPLCGALLPLPAALGKIIHPLVTAYAGWSGSVETMKAGGIVDALDKMNGTWFAPPSEAFVILGAHVIAGTVLAGLGLRRRTVI